jgi:hypothetical protein
LDYRRLGKQRIEALQILQAMLGLVGHYKSQPAAKAWKGCETGLCEYGIECCKVWKERGYVDNTRVRFELIKLQELKWKPLVMPRWIGYEPFHSNQRSRLLYKDPWYYSQFNWVEKPALTYYFPSHLYNM